VAVEDPARQGRRPHVDPLGGEAVHDVAIALLIVVARSECEDEHQDLVDRAELVRVEGPGGATEALRIDDRCLLDEDTRLLALERNREPKARRSGTSASLGANA
jgi:hypothetical protein